ncbi:MAG: 30S ribosomal protein S19 [Candidatus Marinimicrobia bacterium]|nr:30S ribosomal protein S19 [Candidatus Neomarinimicrobiota bacterium]
MSRSSKKGPYVDAKLLKKVMKQKQAGDKKREPIKTWARASQIPPEFVGHYFLVHTGRDFKEIFIDETMVGHRLGEFAATRTFRGHGRIVKRILEKT